VVGEKGANTVDVTRTATCVAMAPAINLNLAGSFVGPARSRSLGFSRSTLAQLPPKFTYHILHTIIVNIYIYSEYLCVKERKTGFVTSEFLSPRK
jgi:hypothetical protein